MGHLALVACGAARVSIPGRSAAGRAVNAYAALSGADNAYGFFAPSVAADVRAVLVTTDRAGRARASVLGFSDSTEADFRLATAVGLFPRASAPLRRALAASWAGSLLGADPGSESVLVRVEYQDLPTMRDYRAGRRPSWVPLYEGTFRVTGRLVATPVRASGSSKHA
jgi:hypothetical protein